MNVTPEEVQEAAAAGEKGCLLVGDSISALVRTSLLKRLQQELGVACAYDTWTGHPTESTYLSLQHLRAEYGLPHHILVVSGTNDLFHPQLFPAALEATLSLLQGHEVYWATATLSGTPAASWGPRT